MEWSTGSFNARENQDGIVDHIRETPAQEGGGGWETHLQVSVRPPSQLVCFDAARLVFEPPGLLHKWANETNVEKPKPYWWMKTDDGALETMCSCGSVLSNSLVGLLDTGDHEVEEEEEEDEDEFDFDDLP